MALHHKAAAVQAAAAASKARMGSILPLRSHKQPGSPPCTRSGVQQPVSNTKRGRITAAAPDTLVAGETLQQPTVDFLGVLNDMQTVRGILETAVDPDLVYDILTDHDSCPRVFRNICGSETLLTEAGDKQVIQACKWQFLAFKGTFNIHLNVKEDPQERLLVFTLAASSFMRDFEGRWQVQPLPGGGSRIEHVLAVKPLLSIPAAVAPYTSSIFKSQVAAVMADLQAELERQAEAAAAAAS